MDIRSFMYFMNMTNAFVIVAGVMLCGNDNLKIKFIKLKASYMIIEQS